ncbi:hypothetical protein ACFL4T_04875 [candidate division KSB1 bacterium]
MFFYKMNVRKLIILCLIVQILFSCKKEPTSSTNNTSGVTGDYFGETPPGTTPVLFNPAIFGNTAAYLYTGPVFSPDGIEMHWSVFTETDVVTRYTKRSSNGQWSSAQTVPYDIGGRTRFPTFSPDGARLFFSSSVPVPDFNSTQKENIWFVEKVGSNWVNPQPLDYTVNRYELHWPVSIASSNNLYYSAVIPPNENFSICISHFEGNQYTSPVSLGDSINSRDSNVNEHTPFISPDESYIIFSVIDDRISGFTDLYISFKKPDGSWTKAKNMQSLNTYYHENCPNVTPDGRYLFYIGTDGPLWVDASVIELYR